MFLFRYNSCKSILEKTELLFTLDFNALYRTGDQMENALKTLTVPSVMIDHHQAPDGYATYTFSDTTYGSTCEMVYDFIYQLGFENLINKTVATCLYTGIVTDSGSFRFPKTTSKTIMNGIERNSFQFQFSISVFLCYIG